MRGSLAVVALAASLLLVAQSQSADRKTDDAGWDAVQALLARQRVEDAEWICRQSIQESNAGLPEHAKWTARLSDVLAEREAANIFAGRPEELLTRLNRAIETSVDPIDRLLGAYPNSQSGVFLETQKLMVRQTLVRRAIVASSVSSSPDVGGLLKQIARLRGDTDRMQTDAESLRDAESGSKQRRADLSRLVREITLMRISLSVLQTELFDAGSDDYRSAAAAAASFAEEAVFAFPERSRAQQEARFLWAEALLRSGDVRSAEMRINELGATTTSPREIAFRVRVALAKDDVSRAESLCDAFYAGDPSQVPLSPEMDIARLQTMLASGEAQNSIAGWLDVIQRRGGAFARRRAEQLALGSLQSGRKETMGSGEVSPAIVAAQGEELLRRGDLQRAVTFLRAAAVNERDPETAFGYAAKCAAVAVKAKQSMVGVETLADVARSHLDHQQSPQVMLQAALLLGKTNPAGDSETLYQLLEEISTTWPQSRSAAQANDWHCRSLVAQDRLPDAAQAALQFVSLSQDASQLDPCLALWFDRLSSIGSSEATSELQILEGSLTELYLGQQAFRTPVFLASTWLFDRPSLELEDRASLGSGTDAAFLLAVGEARRGNESALSAEGVTDAIVTRVRWRLRRDGRLKPKRQTALGAQLQSLPGGDAWDAAEADLWVEGTDASIASIKQLAAKADDRATGLRRAIELLSHASAKKAQLAAVELNEQLAAMMPLGSDDWHATKLDSLKLLRVAGEREEASKRAKYILLTQPPKDEATRARYEALR